jgi:hypothetical protein
MATSGLAKCIYNTCTGTSKNKNPNLTFHRFPATEKDEERCEQWIILSGVRDKVQNLTRTQLRQRYLCSRHFSTTSYYNDKSKNLVKNALPIDYLDNDNNALVKNT